MSKYSSTCFIHESPLNACSMRALGMEPKAQSKERRRACIG